MELTLKEEFCQTERASWSSSVWVSCSSCSQSKGFYPTPVFIVMDVLFNKSPLHFNQRNCRKDLKNYWFRNFHLSLTFRGPQLDLDMCSVVQNWNSLVSPSRSWAQQHLQSIVLATGPGDQQDPLSPAESPHSSQTGTEINSIWFSRQIFVTSRFHR